MITEDMGAFFDTREGSHAELMTYDGRDIAAIPVKGSAVVGANNQVTQRITELVLPSAEVAGLVPGDQVGDYLVEAIAEDDGVTMTVIVREAA